MQTKKHDLEERLVDYTCRMIGIRNNYEKRNDKANKEVRKCSFGNREVSAIIVKSILTAKKNSQRQHAN